MQKSSKFKVGPAPEAPGTLRGLSGFIIRGDELEEAAGEEYLAQKHGKFTIHIRSRFVFYFYP